MDIETAIQQKTFASEKEKALINLLYTSSWVSFVQQRFFKQFGISPEQYNVLRILRGQHPCSVSVSLIQDRMMNRMSNASRLVEKLRQHGLAERSECPKDRRQVDVLISEQGIALLDKIGLRIDELHSVMQSIDCNEALQLNQLLDKLKTTSHN